MWTPRWIWGWISGWILGEFLKCFYIGNYHYKNTSKIHSEFTQNSPRNSPSNSPWNPCSKSSSKFTCKFISESRFLMLPWSTWSATPCQLHIGQLRTSYYISLDHERICSRMVNYLAIVGRRACNCQACLQWSAARRQWWSIGRNRRNSSPSYNKMHIYIL